mgnify:CR=1 FL=1
MDSLLYTLSETVHKQNYAVATYHISLPKEVDVLKKAAALAVGQTIGTWIASTWNYGGDSRKIVWGRW